jgi:hypothetical protein
MVVPPRPDGGQRQLVELPMPEGAGDSLEPVLAGMLAGHRHDADPLAFAAAGAARAAPA